MRRLALAVGGLLILLWGWGLLVVAGGDPSWWAIFAFLGCTLAVGVIVANRVPGNPIGWLLLAVAGFFLLQMPAAVAGAALLDRRPDLAAWLLWFGGDRPDTWTWFPLLWLLFTQVLLHFPDGRLPSPRWRPFWWFTLAVGALGTVALSSQRTEVAPGVPSPAGLLDDSSPLLGLTLLAFLLSVLGSGWSVVWRYRRAAQVQRQQTKWVALAMSVVIAVYLPSAVLGVFQDYDAESLLWAVLALSYSLIPLSIGVAVLRYRLFEIDRIVSRTVSYAVVTGVVLGTYGLVVTSVSRVLPESGALPVAGATLVAAGVFRPVLRRVRDRVDRRFDRARFDGVRAAEAFAGRVGSAVDPDEVAADLVGTVQATLAPRSVGVWLAGGR